MDARVCGCVCVCVCACVCVCFSGCDSPFGGPTLAAVPYAAAEPSQQWALPLTGAVKMAQTTSHRTLNARDRQEMALITLDFCSSAG